MESEFQHDIRNSGIIKAESPKVGVSPSNRIRAAYEQYKDKLKDDDESQYISKKFQMKKESIELNKDTDP